MEGHIRVCRKCGITKSIQMFPPIKRGLYYGRTCKACVNYNRPVQKLSTSRVKRWKEENRSRYLAAKKIESERYRLRRGIRKMEDIIREAEIRRQQKNILKRAIRDAENAARLQSRPWTNSKLTTAEKYKMRYRLDPEFNLKEQIRAHLRRRRQGIKLDVLIRTALQRNGQSPIVEQVLGYSITDLKTHIERQFVLGMTWELFCNGEIHIDHIVPLRLFDLSNIDELKAAWNLSNLQPLWAKDNWAKAGKREFLL